MFRYKILLNPYIYRISIIRYVHEIRTYRLYKRIYLWTMWDHFWQYRWRTRTYKIGTFRTQVTEWLCINF